MITHRMSTQPLPEPPVRFYKIIALSFLLLTVVLLGVVVFITSKTATITIIAKQDTEPVVLAVSVNKDGTGESALHGKVTSNQFAFSKNYEPTGNKKVVGTAKGKVVIYNKSGTSQQLVKTTRLLTPSGVLFRLSESTVVPAGGEVTVPVYADQTGATYDIAPSTFTIPGLNSERQKEVYAESKEAMSGGEHSVGILTSEDIEKAQEDYKQKVKDAYIATLPEVEQGIERIIEVSDVVQKVDHAAGQEVAGYTVSGTSTVVVVDYSTSELSNLLARQVEAKVDTSAERFLSLSKSPTVTVSRVSGKDGTAELSVRQEVGVTLDANVAKLSPDHFYGKKKDEISRYIMALDHVQGVEVKFSPSWVFTAPTVSDRIHLVVKNI